MKAECAFPVRCLPLCSYVSAKRVLPTSLSWHRRGKRERSRGRSAAVDDDVGQREHPTATSGLVVAFNCRWCGKQIEIAEESGREALLDVAAFLAVHRRCVDRSG